VAMSLSTIIVTANAQLLRRLRLQRAVLERREPSSKQLLGGWCSGFLASSSGVLRRFVYQKLLHEAKKLSALSSSGRPRGRLNRIRSRFLELHDIDFFGNPLRTKVENLLAQADEFETVRSGHNDKRKSGEYLNRLWMTRPRPGIDWVS